MRSMKRNKRTIYYALYNGTEEVVDENGDLTGEKRIVYTEPKELKINVSSPTGRANPSAYGVNIAYDKTMVTNDTKCPITETSILWVGISPRNNTPHNYTVAKKGDSLNSITYYIKEVSKSA